MSIINRPGPGRSGNIFTRTTNEIVSDLQTLGRTVVTTNWAGGIRDAFDRLAGRTDVTNVPRVPDATVPDDATTKQADAILSRSRKAVFNRLEFFPRAVMDEVGKLDPKSPVIEQIFSRIDPLC